MALPRSFKDMTGMRFERLVVIKQAESDSNGNARWHCKCDCGKTTISHGFGLRNGSSKSCGCLTTEQLIARNTTHALSTLPEWRIWCGMRARCRAPHSPKLKRLYKSKGIYVCERWLDFRNFLADMGPRPSRKHSVERRDGAKGYNPENCYWATPSQQANNTTQNHKVIYHGKEMNLVQAIRAAGDIVCYGTVKSRLRYGWDIEDAVELPPFTPR